MKIRPQIIKKYFLETFDVSHLLVMIIPAMITFISVRQSITFSVILNGRNFREFGLFGFKNLNVYFFTLMLFMIFGFAVLKYKSKKKEHTFRSLVLPISPAEKTISTIFYGAILLPLLHYLVFFTSYYISYISNSYLKPYIEIPSILNYAFFIDYLKALIITFSFLALSFIVNFYVIIIAYVFFCISKSLYDKMDSGILFFSGNDLYVPSFSWPQYLLIPIFILSLIVLYRSYIEKQLDKKFWL